MSTKIMAKCWPLQMGLAQKAVLMSLADQANDDGLCWPSVGSIATRVCASERTITRIIGELERAGYLTLERVPGKSTRYILTPDRGSPPTEDHPRQRITPPLILCHPTPDRGSPPYIDPSLNRHRTHKGERFEEFWSAYPKKRSKGQAEKAWAKLKPSEQLVATILAAIERAKTSAEWQKEGGQFIPYPASWLNAKGWEDDVRPAPPPQPERREPRFRDVN